MRTAPIVFAAAAIAAATARADPPARLVYDAPATCPDAAAFAAAVQGRAPRATFAADAPRVFAIAITATADGFTGSVTAPESSVPRALAASRCDDLVGALALVTALAIDPSALVDVPPPVRPVPVPPPHPVSPPQPAPVPPPPAREAPRRNGAALFIGPELDDGVARDVLPAVAVEGRFVRAGLGHVDLGAIYGRNNTMTGAGAARFSWLVGRAGACWTAHDGAIAADACAHADVGMLEAAGVDIVRAQDLQRSWFDLGVHAAARWESKSNVFGELRVGASVPLERDRFYFAPAVFIHQAAAVTPWIDLGAGVRF